MPGQLLNWALSWSASPTGNSHCHLKSSHSKSRGTHLELGLELRQAQPLSWRYFDQPWQAPTVHNMS